ncbi:MAG: hypothetical protein A4E35_01601 [Methanoregula sp. PtaU1.Bin051]|nr:MAG: hypothetical protein A4E35_01601 [Methanoregula sp. PtaU1.Bin051]
MDSLWRFSEDEERIRTLWKDKEYRAKAAYPACTICGLDYRQCNSNQIGLKCEPAD